MKKITSALFCIAILATNARATTVLYHRYDGDPDIGNGNAATSILDSSSGGNNSNTILNSPTYSNDVFGSPIPQTEATNNFSLDLERDSSQRYIVADNNNLDFGPGSAFTIEAWVKLETLGSPSSGASRQYLLQKKSSNSSDNLTNYTFLVQAGNAFGSATGQNLAFQIGNGSSNTAYLSNFQINDTTSWHYVSVRFDDTTDTLTFNLNGSEETLIATQSIAANNLDLIIGAHTGATGITDATFDGKIDELRISNTFLSDSELLYSAVPEPSTYAILAGIFCLGLTYLRRRHGKSKCE